MLETVDLSGNELRGAAPGWLAKMFQGTIKKLNLTRNRLTGDYTDLANLVTGFVRTSTTIPQISITPQRPCPRTEYLKTDPTNQLDLGRCSEVPPAEAVLVAQSDDVLIDIEKPSSTGKEVALVLTVSGGSLFTPQYAAVMTHLNGPQQFSSRTFSALADPHFALAGLHAEWRGVAPSADNGFELSAADGRFSESKVFNLTVSANCSGTLPCVADGDTIQTVFTIGSATSPARHYTGMKISTQIKSLPSCDLSMARLQGPATVDPSTDILSLEASLLDVDNMPIGVSSPKVTAIWNNETFFLERDAPRSNRFRWEIPSSLRREPGLYTFHVLLELGWDEVLRAKGRCKLLEGTVNVAKGFDTKWVLVGSIICALILVGVALFVVHRYREQLMNIAVTLVTEVVKLGFSISLDIGGIVTEYAPRNERWPA
jgi:hypothetical protein